ncbi:hypothetical protein H5410_035131 [Solanum commersonii]|uniref:Uncharacterized protein n=1 Tax=Solanum commersonii TaxID=4109 RepID=A0A9J5XZU6_SOLCO|nr:hypothetical protein H5410_035131 [Solanum commersonii]
MGKQGYFQVQTSPKEGKPDFTNFRIFGDSNSNLFLVKFFMDVHYDFINGVSWSQWKNREIFMFKRIPKISAYFCQNFAWKSIKTLLMA